jgi:hypothetical protein
VFIKQRDDGGDERRRCAIIINNIISVAKANTIQNYIMTMSVILSEWINEQVLKDPLAGSYTYKDAIAEVTVNVKNKLSNIQDLVRKIENPDGETVNTGDAPPKRDYNEAVELISRTWPEYTGLILNLVRSVNEAGLNVDEVMLL